MDMAPTTLAHASACTTPPHASACTTPQEGMPDDVVESKKCLAFCSKIIELFTSLHGKSEIIVLNLCSIEKVLLVLCYLLDMWLW